MKTKVKNMLGSSGKEVPNQFIIFTNEGVYFQSYGTTIAFRPPVGKIQLDKDAWNYSRTTAKYRNQFLRLTTKEVKAMIKSSEIELVNLN